jgi:hypothetical protein
MLRTIRAALSELQWRRLPRLAAYVALTCLILSPVILLQSLVALLWHVGLALEWLCSGERLWVEWLCSWAEDVERWYLHAGCVECGPNEHN